MWRRKKKALPLDVCGPGFSCGDAEYYYVCVLIVVVGGLANASCHALNFPTYINNLLKAVETGDSKSEKLRIWLIEMQKNMAVNYHI